MPVGSLSVATVETGAVTREKAVMTGTGAQETGVQSVAERRRTGTASASLRLALRGQQLDAATANTTQTTMRTVTTGIRFKATAARPYALLH